MGKEVLHAEGANLMAFIKTNRAEKIEPLTKEQVDQADAKKPKLASVKPKG